MARVYNVLSYTFQRKPYFFYYQIISALVGTWRMVWVINLTSEQAVLPDLERMMMQNLLNLYFIKRLSCMRLVFIVLFFSLTEERKLIVLQ
jgi:hypothetical protein